MFTPTLKTGDFKGRVNGKTVSISMSRESSYIGSEKLELKMDSPIPNVNHVEVSNLDLPTPNGKVAQCYLWKRAVGSHLTGNFGEVWHHSTSPTFPVR